MRKELENIKLIEQYLRNELTAADKQLFEEKLAASSQLQDEVEAQRKVLKGIERIGARQSVQSAQRRYQNRRRGFFLGLFLVIVVAGVLGVNYLTNQDNVMADVKETNVVNEIEVIDSKDDSLQYVQTDIETQASETESNIVSLPKKKYQYFNVNPSEDFTIKGSEGTIITFKANLFNTSASKIKIRLKEYYDMSDIAFSNLTTETVDSKLLETGGMIYIDAIVDGKKLELKKDKVFDVKFPFEKKKKDMKLFDGKKKGQSIVWEQVETTETITEVFEVEEEPISPSQVFTIVEKMPEFKTGQEGLFQYLNKNIKYPAAAKAMKIAGKVYVNFTIYENGRVGNVQVLRGVHPLLDNEAIRVVQNMPLWTPGQQRGKPVNVSYNLPINFSLSGSTVGYTPEQIKQHNDSIKKERLADVEEEIFSENESTQKKGARSQQKATNDINYYVFSGARLGWINCDRFVGRSGKLQVMVKLEDDLPTDVKMIFHSIKGIMSGYKNGPFSRFARVPRNEKVTIFAVKYKDKRPFVCLKEIRTSTTPVELEFEELTKERLIEITKEIENI